MSHCKPNADHCRPPVLSFQNRIHPQGCKLMMQPPNTTWIAKLRWKEKKPILEDAKTKACCIPNVRRRVASLKYNQAPSSCQCFCVFLLILGLDIGCFQHIKIYERIACCWRYRAPPRLACMAVAVPTISRKGPQTRTPQAKGWPISCGAGLRGLGPENPRFQQLAI